jgi:hypothetical protein
VTQQLIGDRFLVDATGRAIDLATGWAVRVIVRPIDDDWGRIEGRLKDESRARRTSWPRLVDFGRVNADEWFEARSPRRTQVSDRMADACRTAANQVVSIAGAGPAGIRHVRVVSPRAGVTALASAIATEVRPLGFLTLRADAPLDPALVDVLAHRHLVVLYRSNTNRAPVIRWIRDLPGISPRPHLVVELDDEEKVWVNVHQFPVSGWHERVATACFEARMLMDTSRREQAEALLAALDAEAAVRRIQPPDALHMTWVRLRSCQGRVEEAQKRLSALSTNRGSCERDNASASRHPGPAAVRARR